MKIKTSYIIVLGILLIIISCFIYKQMTDMFIADFEQRHKIELESDYDYYY